MKDHGVTLSACHRSPIKVINMAGLQRSFMFSAIDRLGNIAINLVTMATVARLLTPDEVGVFVVGAAVALVIQTLRDTGAAIYLIQEPNVTREGVQTTFTISCIIGLILAIALYLLAAPVAALYSEQRLRPILQIMSVGVLIACLANVPVALIRRDLEFGHIAVINLLGSLVNLVAVIILILSGFSYLSLPWATVASLSAMTITTICLRPLPWMYRFDLSEWRRVLEFSSYSSVAAILSNALTMLPQFIIGRMIGFDAVGIFSRAVIICQLPDRSVLSAFMPVVLPALAAEVRDGADLRPTYLRGLSLTSVIYLPVMLCIAFLAQPVVEALLGDQWARAAPLVRILCIASLCLFPVSLNFPILVAKGRIRDTVTMMLILLPLTALVIFVSAIYGLTAVALTAFITAPAQAGLSFWFVRRQIPFEWKEIASSIRDSIIVMLCAGLVPMMTVIAFGSRPDLIPAAIAAAGATAGWFLGAWATAHPLLSYLTASARMFLSRLTRRANSSGK